MERIYISGKMTGLSKQQILKKFNKAEKFMTKRGFSVMNPAVTYYMKNIKDFSYDDWLKIDFAMLDACDAIYMLNNYEDSPGAQKELDYAIKNKKAIIYEK